MFNPVFILFKTFKSVYVSLIHNYLDSVFLLSYTISGSENLLSKIALTDSKIIRKLIKQFCPYVGGKILSLHS